MAIMSINSRAITLMPSVIDRVSKEVSSWEVLTTKNMMQHYPGKLIPNSEYEEMVENRFIVVTTKKKSGDG